MKTFGTKLLSKMLPDVLYPKSAYLVQMLTKVPLDKTLMKQSKDTIKQFMKANKIAFSSSDSMNIIVQIPSNVF